MEPAAREPDPGAAVVVRLNPGGVPAPDGDAPQGQTGARREHLQHPVDPGGVDERPLRAVADDRQAVA